MAEDDQHSPTGTSEPLTLRLLGAPQITCGGAPLQTDTKKAIALLAYLGTEPGEHERDALASLLWTSDDIARNKAALRRTLSTAQKALARLGAAPLITSRKTIAAPAAAWRVDARQLREHLDHPIDAPPPKAQIEEAIALYQGSFLAGFTLQEGTPFETWCQEQSYALEAIYLQGLSWLMAGYEAAEAWTQAIPLALRWLQLDPLDESIHQKLIRWYIADGQRDAALQQYESCQEQLSEGLGTKPSPATRQLLTLLQSADASTPPPSLASESVDTSPAPSDESSTSHEASLAPLLGRDKEKAEVLALLADATCRWLTIKGPFGAGKSHLARHITEALDGAVSRFDAHEQSTPEALYEAVTASLPAQETPASSGTLWLLVDQLDEASPFGEMLLRLLRQWPALRLLVCARSQASVRGEWVYELDELRHNFGHADDVGDVGDGGKAVEVLSPAARLFEWYAQKHAHDFVLADQGAFDRLYGLLGGHPLALEMAAAWCHVLGLEALVETLASDLSMELSMLERVDAAGQTVRLEALFHSAWEVLPAAQQGICQAMAQADKDWFTTKEWLALPGASLPLLLALRDGAWLRRDADERVALWAIMRTCLRASP